MGTTSPLPRWIKPQLTRLVDNPPAGDDWLHEIKYDGYRRRARLDGGQIKLLTRTGVGLVASLSAHDQGPGLNAGQVGHGELCALNPDGVPSFSRLQAAMDEGKTDALVYFVFDLLRLNGESTVERKARLQKLFAKEIPRLRYSDHVWAMARAFVSGPASLASRAPSRNASTVPTSPVIAASCSSRSV